MKLDSSIAAVVTGGASGLGEGTARAIAATGAKVALFDLNAEKGEAIAAEITWQMGRPIAQTPGEVRGFEERARHMLEVAPGALADLDVGEKPGFTRFIRHWVRERQAVPLIEGIRKVSLIPAQILEASTPAMAGKGRLAVGADADVVVFDYDTLSDKAEFTAMNRPAEGVRHLIVSGVPVIADGVMDVAARPGRPVRRPAITR